MRDRDLKIGDFVKCLKNKGSKGLIVGIIPNEGVRLPPMAEVLWSDGTSTTRWQDDLTLVLDQQYLIQ